MYFAPFGVGAAIAVTVGHLGIDILKNLALLLITLYLALIAFLLVVLLPIALCVAKIPVRKFIQAIREPVSIAFATTSSDSALPKALENMEKFGVPQEDRIICNTYRLYIQPGWYYFISFIGIRICSAGSWYAIFHSVSNY